MNTVVENDPPKPSLDRISYAKRLAGMIAVFLGIYLLLSVMRYLKAPPIADLAVMLAGVGGLLVYWLVQGFRRARDIGKLGLLKPLWLFFCLVMLPNLHPFGFVVATVFLLLMPSEAARKEIRSRRAKMKEARAQQV